MSISDITRIDDEKKLSKLYHRLRNEALENEEDFDDDDLSVLDLTRREARVKGSDPDDIFITVGVAPTSPSEGSKEKKIDVRKRIGRCKKYEVK